MKLNELLNMGICELKKNNIDEFTLKARILLAAILKMSKEELIIHDSDEINIDDEKIFEKYIKQLIKGKPLEYITNRKEFMRMNFFVNESVLIPRSDTEVLVEEVINYCEKENKKEYNILDLCTGSGVVGISIAKYIPKCKVLATDISKSALEVAKKNAKINKINNIKFKQSNLFNGIKEKFDIIVSNPPYIKTDIIETLSKEVKNEPYIALNGGDDGLYFYNEILKYAYSILNENGALFMEIGYDQKEEVINLLRNTEKYKNIECVKDLYGNDRVIKCII